MITPVWSEEITEAEYDRLSALLNKDQLDKEPDSIVQRRIRARYVQSIMSIYSQEHKYRINQGFSVIDDINKILIIADKTLYDNIASYILRYAHDIHNYFGCQIDIFTVEGETYEDVKNLIVSQSTNLSGVVFIGDITEANYYAGKHSSFSAETFPCDLYYMDINGTWTDDGTGILISHSGDVNPEIFVGRINTFGMGGDELSEIKLFFNRNHDFWSGKTIIKKKYALTFTTKDWQKDIYWNGISPLYGQDNYSVIKDNLCTVDKYLSCLSNSKYEFIQLACHSDYTQHRMEGGYINQDGIYNTPKKQFGYNLYCCKSCRWTYSSSSRCLGESYLYGEQTMALTLLGSTKTGGMLGFDDFYLPLGEGIPIGNALKSWWIDFVGNIHDSYDVHWYYGLCILGDPLINFHYSNECEDELILNNGEETTNRMYYAQSKIIVKDYTIAQGKQVILNAPTIEIVGPFECNSPSLFTTNTAEYCVCNDTISNMNRIRQKPNTDEGIGNCKATIANKFSCYPNPANDYIFVDALDPIEYIHIYNINGELMTKTTDKSICLEQLPNGIYVLHIVTERGILKTKFIHL